MDELSYEDEDYLIEVGMEWERERKQKQELFTGGY
jgi:hypothetical protein